MEAFPHLHTMEAFPHLHPPGVPVGQEPLTNSDAIRATSATAVTDCRLLQLSATAIGLSAGFESAGRPA